MTQISVNHYLHQVEESFTHKDGESAAKLVSCRDPHVMNCRLQLERPESMCEKWFDPPLDEVIAAHLRCCWAVNNHDLVEACNCQFIVVSAFLKLFQAHKDENWALPVLFCVTLDLRMFAQGADLQQMKEGRGKSGEYLEKAAEVLMGCFRVCASDNRAAPEDSKKWGMLNLVNQLFKIYFKINKLHLCKPLIRAIDSLPIKEKFSLSHLVTYKYYVGRKAMFDSDFKCAEEYLSFAFQHCHRQARNNKRLILIYLIPVKMLLGYMPRKEMLQKYSLLQFTNVSHAVSSGNLRLLNESLQQHEAFFIKNSIYLILEKLKVIAYRNLIKKVTLILKSHQLPISAFTIAFHWMGEQDMDDDEIQCILANLIFEDKIKGYLSQQHKKLVISKQSAFPSLLAKQKFG